MNVTPATTPDKTTNASVTHETNFQRLPEHQRLPKLNTLTEETSSLRPQTVFKQLASARNTCDHDHNDDDDRSIESNTNILNQNNTITATI